jgi:hypothetical protein
MKLQNEAWRRRKRRSREEVKRLIDEFEASGSASQARSQLAHAVMNVSH